MCKQADMTDLTDRMHKKDINAICTRDEPIQSGKIENLQI